MDPVELAPFRILDFVPAGCCIIAGEKGTIIFWNRILETWTAWSSQSLLGASLFDTFPHLGQPRFKDRILEVLHSGTPAIFSSALNPQFFLSRRPGGKLRVQQTTLNRLEDGLGPDRLVLITVADVTDQFERGEKYREARAVALEEARVRKESEEKQRIVNELSSDGILIGGADGRIQDCNPAAGGMFGYSKAELLGMSVMELIPEGFEKIFQQIVTGGADLDARMEMKCRRADGALFPGEILARNFLGAGGRQFVIYIHDATDRRCSEEILRRAQKQESLGTLAGGIAHDFNNILGGILGNLDLAEIRLKDALPCTHYLENIRSGIQRAADLSRKMLAFSGKAPFSMTQVDLNQVVLELLPLFQATTGRKAALSFSGSPEPALILADLGQIHQLLLALVNNASEAVGNQGGRIEITVESQTLDKARITRNLPGQSIVPGPYVTLSVHDNGCGISPENAPRIFDPFFTTKSTGRGLSLAVSQGILRGHRGGIRFSSPPGAGTTFTLYFPSAPAHLLERPTAEAPRAELENLSRTILLVDDEDVLREAVAEFLQDLGYRVLTACDGQEAVASYREFAQEIGIVVMDLTMPTMGGREAFFAIRELHPAARVILSSGYSEHEVWREFEGMGLAGFLPKPYTLSQLEQVVTRAFQG